MWLTWCVTCEPSPVVLMIQDLTLRSLPHPNQSCIHEDLVRRILKAFPLVEQPVYSSNQALHPGTV